MGAGHDETKRKLRKLKGLEQKIRRGRAAGAALVWDGFFTVKYPIKIVAAMDRATYKKVIEEYFYHVYYRFCAENKTGAAFNDPEALARLGLPYDAGAEEIRRRFRELAKLYHPDAGGDAGDFIELKESYDKLAK